jgi:uncharacterized protein (TIGR00369 family)
MQLSWGDGCFVCGSENTGGLRLRFDVDPKQRSISTRWVPSDTYQGYAGILHGGIISTLLDECVGKLAVELDLPAVTAELAVRFLKPVPLDRPLTARGTLTDVGRRVILGEAEILLEDQTLAARATAKLLRSPA